MTKEKDPKCVVHIGDNLKSIQLIVEPDKEWIEFVMHYSDIFGNPGIGYWARGMERTKKLGWLLYEHGDERKPPDETPKDVLAAWRNGNEPLPPYWFRLDRNTALRAQAEGIKLKGIGWYNAGDTDAFFYDRIIQRVIFGEEKYG